ncbi:protein of unknown function [Hyphomicrobium sp. MC1]|nr:protein of unknown function [Hyphomicrobium sp. MC1]
MCSGLCWRLLVDHCCAPHGQPAEIINLAARRLFAVHATKVWMSYNFRAFLLDVAELSCNRRQCFNES